MTYLSRQRTFADVRGKTLIAIVPSEREPQTVLLFDDQTFVVIDVEFDDEDRDARCACAGPEAFLPSLFGIDILLATGVLSGADVVEYKEIERAKSAKRHEAHAALLDSREREEFVRLAGKFAKRERVDEIELIVYRRLRAKYGDAK